MKIASLSTSPLSFYQRAALPILFILLGLTYANWASRIPFFRDALALDPATLGTALMGAGIGAVASFPLAAWLIAHWGARHTLLICGIALLASQPLLACAPNWLILMGILFLLGGALSAFDVAVNVIGAELEKLAKRSLMSMLHAWFCVGTLIGALLGSAAEAIEMTPFWHFLCSNIVLLALLFCAYRQLPHDQPNPNAERQVFAWPHGGLVVLGVIAFLGALAEGSLTDWIALYLRDHLQASKALAPLGYACFAGAMLVGRILGDRIKERFGAQRLVSFGCVLATLGLCGSIIADTPGLAMIGFGCAGLGIAALFPCIFSAAGRASPTALAGVATLGYSGSLLGPPLMGYVVHGFGLQIGVALLALACLMSAIIALKASLLR